MNEADLIRLTEKQRKFFSTGETLNIRFRLNALQQLKKLIITNENRIFEALKKDLGKPVFESYTGETGMVLQELNMAIRNLGKWSRPKRVYTPLVHFIARSYYYYEPYGCVLIISPWNYPFQLLFNPLIGAIAAGNCVLAKPSQYAIQTAEVMIEIINNSFNPDYIHLVRGGREINQWLLKMKYDYIFFTGSLETGKQVMRSAAENLTPVSLELGGKCPVIVSEDANPRLAARRILWGKMLNAGQSCVAPDYVLAHSDIKDDLLSEMKLYLQKTFGQDPSQSPDFCRIINISNAERIRSYLAKGKIIYGGITDPSNRFISPTLIENITPDDPVMREEIFGPILPVLSYNNLEEAIEFINTRPQPLALYLFTRSEKITQKVMKRIQSGAIGINETVVYFINPYLPFGGIGKSGMGRYHGRFSYETFSFRRSVIKKSNLIDIPLRYPPYRNKIRIVRMLIR